MTNNVFYVYEYTRLDTNEVFYVGKGKGNRYKEIKKRNDVFLAIINSTTYKVEKILEDLSESDAFEAEVSFIKYRKSLGQASCNLTNGGEGSSGYITKDSTKQLLSTLLKGRTSPMKGRKQSDEAKIKNSKSHRGKKRSIQFKENQRKAASKQVIDTSTGIIYSSLKEASVVTGISYGLLKAWLGGFNKNKTTLIYLSSYSPLNI